MKNNKLLILSLIFLFLCHILLVAQERKEINILFIGNSFTERHDLSALVKQVIEEGKPGLTVHVGKLIYGGQSLFQHYEYYFSQSFIEQRAIDSSCIMKRVLKMEELLKVEENPEAYVHFWKDIRGRPAFPDFPKDLVQIAIHRHQGLMKNNPATTWDYVVLQSWQDVSADLGEGYAKYATLFAEIAQKQGSEVILYITAPEIQNATPVSSPRIQERVATEIEVALQIADNLNPTAVIHVPLAINIIQQGGTDLTFCYVNDFHPNQRAAYLTANIFYAAFFNESPEGLGFSTVTETKTHPSDADPGLMLDPDGGPPTVTFTGEQKAYLQRMAYESAMEFNRLWKE